MKLMPAIRLRKQICAYVNALSDIVTSTMTIANVNVRNNVNTTSECYNKVVAVVAERTQVPHAFAANADMCQVQCFFHNRQVIIRRV